MKHYHFKTIVNEQLEHCYNTLVQKSEEYSGPKDRLHNFRVAASLEGITEKQALGGMMAKHTVSIYDMIRDDDDISMAQWEEKITDHINYLLLLRAMVEEDLKGPVLNELDPGDDEASVSRMSNRQGPLLETTWHHTIEADGAPDAGE